MRLQHTKTAGGEDGVRPTLAKSSLADGLAGDPSPSAMAGHPHTQSLTPRMTRPVLESCNPASDFLLITSITLSWNLAQQLFPPIPEKKMSASDEGSAPKRIKTDHTAVPAPFLKLGYPCCIHMYTLNHWCWHSYARTASRHHLSVVTHCCLTRTGVSFSFRGAGLRKPVMLRPRCDCRKDSAES